MSLASVLSTAFTRVGTEIKAVRTEFIAKTLIDAKGDLVVGTAADTAGRLAVGANDRLLIADSSQAGGLRWATPAEVRTALALVVGTNVQAYDADLDSWAGKTAPSGTAVGTSDTQTLTNKRVTKRVVSTTSTATLTVDSDSYDIAILTAQAAGLTVAAPTGTPTDGQMLLFRFKDNGTARAISWNAAFRALLTALPTTTVISKTMYALFIWNAADSKWDCLDAGSET